ncbi:MAG: hypothetical protein WAJ93_20375, partial [Candidatus Nitrosopolaris sp.]
TTTPSGSAMQKYLAIMISSINFLIKDGDALFVFDCFCYHLAGPYDLLSAINNNSTKIYNARLSSYSSTCF